LAGTHQQYHYVALGHKVNERTAFGKMRKNGKNMSLQLIPFRGQPDSAVIPMHILPLWMPYDIENFCSAHLLFLN
jgi:hypothetical protein